MAAIGSSPRVRVWRVESKQAIEVKTGGGVANKNQRKRLTMLREFGAVAGVVHSVDQAVAAVAAALHGEWIPGKGLEL